MNALLDSIDKKYGGELENQTEVYQDHSPEGHHVDDNIYIIVNDDYQSWTLGGH